MEIRALGDCYHPEVKASAQGQGKYLLKARITRLAGFSSCPRILWKGLWIRCAKLATGRLYRGLHRFDRFLYSVLNGLLPNAAAGMLQTL
ncbi:hypothetical protein D3C76_838640 [compost metagenome]|uniref:Uncharacterized protein n=1 Tax=Pseudomonas wadenswilerensis TaxID=1785161 RepID=A0A380T5I5_9PSED|nr:hypothetical protein [Pseudomonas]UVM22471.1 hypothetical protein LOY45_02565 [Pseudomonas wadenswilerensis]SUQ65522.1 hypothetical protein CCOS864_04997 [Pseudomonas wadenswilerensis]